MSGRSTERVTKEHKASGKYIGKYIAVDGLKAFVLDWGEDDPIFCIQGVSTSSYLY